MKSHQPWPTEDTTRFVIVEGYKLEGQFFRI